MGRTAVKLGLPAGSGAEALLQGAMERPEQTAEEFRLPDSGYCLKTKAPAATWRKRRGQINRGWSEGSP